MKTKIICLLIAVLLMPAMLLAQGLSSVEKKLVEAVEASSSEQVAVLEKVVNIDSGTFNVAGVRELGRFFQKELEALGFQTRWSDMPEAMHRAGHLVAVRGAPNGTGKRVLLIGHIDTVFEGAGHRFERVGDTIRGAGVMDMKGGDTVILFALKALHSRGMLDGAEVRVILTGDEENPGTPTTVSRKDLVDAAHKSDIALSFEPDLGKLN